MGCVTRLRDNRKIRHIPFERQGRVLLATECDPVLRIKIIVLWGDVLMFRGGAAPRGALFSTGIMKLHSE